MKNISFDHINMTVSSFERSAQWYERILGFRIVEQGKDEEGKPWGVLKNGESMLCIYEEPTLRISNSDAGAHKIYHFGIRIRDLQEWENILQREKPKLLYGISIRYPHSTSWYVQDPNGHEIELSYWDRNEVFFAPYV
jgi:catechol-2,3-dioxygenase